MRAMPRRPQMTISPTFARVTVEPRAQKEKTPMRVGNSRGEAFHAGARKAPVNRLLGGPAGGLEAGSASVAAHNPQALLKMPLEGHEFLGVATTVGMGRKS